MGVDVVAVALARLQAAKDALVTSRHAARDKSTQVILADTAGPKDISSTFKVLAAPGGSNATAYGLQAGSSLAIGRSTDGGDTFIAGGALTGDSNASAMVVMPTTGTVLVAVVSSTATPAVPAAISAIYRSTNSLGTRTLVHDMRNLAAPESWYGYATPFSFRSGVTQLTDGTPKDIAVVGEYGYKTGASMSANNSRRVRASIDDGLTWTQILDNGDYNNQHVHATFVDSRGWVWVTYGDVGGDNTLGIGGNPALANPGAIKVFRSKNVAQAITDGVAPTWESWLFTYAGRTAQAVDLIDGNDGFMYFAEDRNSAGNVFRFPAANPSNANFEAMLSPDLSEANNFPKWSSGIYHLFRDSNGTFWGYFVGELATSQGRIACSPDGKSWVTVLNTGNTGVSPTAGRFVETSQYVFYLTWRFPKYKPQRLAGFAPTQVQSRQRSTTPGAPVAAGTYTEFLRIDPATLGFGFRLVAVELFVGTATDTCSLAVTNAAGTNMLVTNPSVAAGATTTARVSRAGIKRGPTQRVVGSDVVNVALTVGAGGATDITVTALIEHEQQPHPAQIG